MTPELEFALGNRHTRVHVARGGLSVLGKVLRAPAAVSSGSCAALVTDATVGRSYGAAVRESLDVAGWTLEVVTLKPGEGSKSLSVLGTIYDAFARAHLQRDGLVVALGGGVVSDVAGLAAATWMRGVAFAICPTTLEAQIDAAIGGKTAANIPAGKNLIGAFHPAEFVLIDPGCLSTLDPRDLRAGMAESVKHALITSDDFLAWHEAHVDDVLGLDPQVVEQLIVRNVRIKAAIVERDPFETTGERRILNFGHTIGHAIENACGYRLRHGECVGLGMLAACRISNRLTGLPGRVTARVESLLARFGLPTRLANAPPLARILETMALDKKGHSGRLRFVLLEDVGRPVTRGDVEGAAVGEAYESLLP